MDREPEVVDLPHLPILQFAVDPDRWERPVVEERRRQVPITTFYLCAVRAVYK